MFLICFGTRPEYIKVKSLIDNLKNVKTCFTGQHPDLLKNINADFILHFFSFKTPKNKLEIIISNLLYMNRKLIIFDDLLGEKDEIIIELIRNNERHKHLLWAF